MSPGARMSIENAIWLCSICATKIDRDVDRYPPQLLRDWKAGAEAQAIDELGKRQPAASDARDQLNMALTGLPVAFAPSAIANVHVASQLALQKLDPRFRVETSYKEKTTTVTLHALEQIPMSFQIGPTAADSWRQQLQGLAEHGSVASLSSADVSLSGSPLLQEVMASYGPKGGRIVLAPHTKPAIVKLSLVNENTKQVISQDDVQGELAGGRKSFTFKGKTFGDLLSVSIRADITPTPTDADFSLEVDLRCWESVDVRLLPYFERLAQFYTCVLDDWAIDARLEALGMSLMDGCIRLPADSSLLRATQIVLEYTRRARVLASKLGTPLRFELSSRFSAVDHAALAEVVDLLEGGQEFGRERLQSSITSTVVLAAGLSEARQLLESQSNAKALLFQEQRDAITVFGQLIDLPLLETRMSGVTPKIIGEPTPTSEGEVVLVEWLPDEDFVLSRRFVTKATEA